jgi:two-component system, NarL family, sensor histidine kinase DevS
MAAPTRPAADRSEALLQAGLTLASELELDAVLQRIIELATSLSGARYGALGVLGPEGRIIEFITTGVSPDERALIGHPPVGRGILGVLIQDARPLRLEDIGSDPRSFGFPPNHPPMRSFLGAPVKARGRVFGNIYLTEKAGAAQFTEEDERTLEVLAAQAGVAVENARLHEEAVRRSARLEAMGDVAAAMLQGRPLEEVLALLARHALELLDADLATVAVPTDERLDSLQILVAEGAGAEELRGMVFPIEGSISGEVVRTGRSVAIEDATADPHTLQPIVRAGDVGPALLVPLNGRDGPIGSLTVANRLEGRVFDEDDLATLETFARQAGVAVEYERIRSELERLAVLEDRERIAKELHDGVIQALFAVGMGLQGTAALSQDPELERRIDGAVTEIDGAIRDLRNYIFGLRPGILADRQLDQAVRTLAAEFEERTGVTTVVDVDSRVAAELSSTSADVIQLAREALSNVGRHANATTARVSLSARDGKALLEIDDDGRGFDPAGAAEGGGHGLRNLASRAEALGGTLDIESTAAEGTTIRVRLPLG